MDNWLQNSGNPIILEIYISADDTTNGVLEIPLQSNFAPVEFTVLPGITTRLEVPSELAEAFGSKILNDQGLHITTDNEVSVYAMNKRQYSADVAVILPVISLSNNYIVMAHWEDGNRNSNDNSDSEFLIVATEDDTEIEITPSVNIEGGGSAGVPFTIIMDRGQTYQVQARADLTGTTIVGKNNSAGECSNFAVYAGNQYTKVGRCNHPDGHDHLYAQMYPIKTWGTEYTIVDYETRIGGDVVKVLASEDNTSVNVQGQTFVINSGNFLSFRLEGVNVITSDKPIAVGQFSRSQGCDGTRGDPFFIMISPDQQLLKSITFNAPPIATVTNYSMNVITPTSDVPNVRFDGQNISGLFQQVPDNPSMSYARVVTTGGNHTLLSEEGFIAYVYGYGNNESFGYATGAGLSNLSLGVDIINQSAIQVPTDSICLNDQSFFSPLTAFEFDTYIYDFGDGRIVERDEKSPVSHQYASTGTYVFRLTGLDDQDNCQGGSEATEVRVIKVINPQLDVRGPRSVCPNTPGVEYFVEDNTFFQNEWFVEGGSFVSVTNNSVVVDWGATNNQAGLKLLSRNRYNCPGDTVLYPVRINIQLEPEAPFGPDSLCAESMTGIAYDTYFTQGSVYDWQIENGEIASGQGTNQITVNWFSAGTGRLWFDQMAQTDTICDGTSDVLEVFIQRVPDPLASIFTDKTVYQIEEPVNVSFAADPLLQLVNLSVDGVLYEDSLDLNSPWVMDFDCPGVYELQIEVFDTIGVCPNTAMGARTITVLEPILEIVNVSHDTEIDSTLHTRWYVQYADFKSEPFQLQRLGSNWINLLDINERSGDFVEQDLSTSNRTYTYRISGEDDCIEPYLSRSHTSMVLEAEKENDEEVASLSWNSYEGWEMGVREYEIERRIDDGDWEVVGTSSTVEFSQEYDSLGFDYCFRVRAFEAGGNLSDSYSNTSCVFFVPPLYPYNLITPNGDGLNDEFVIEGVELYENSRLIIYNRWGRTVLETVGYQNDWQGTENGKDLSSGVYYYVLELNEPRVELKQINGIVSVLR